MSANEPMRLRDPASEAPEQLRALLEAARHARPSAEEAAILEQRIAGVLGAPINGAEIATGAGKVSTAPAVLAAKLLSILGLLAVATLAAISIRARDREPQPAPPKPQPMLTAPATVADGDHAAPSASSIANERPPAPSAQRAQPRSPRKTRNPPPARPEPASGAPVVLEPKASAEAPRSDAEIVWIDAAHRALRTGDAEEALRLAERHAAEFEHGLLSEEREVIAIRALIALDRIDRASRRLSAFDRDHPLSAHRARLRGDLERGVKRRRIP